MIFFDPPAGGSSNNKTQCLFCRDTHLNILKIVKMYISIAYSIENFKVSKSEINAICFGRLRT